MALLRTFLGFLIAIALTAFAVFNRQDISLIYSPIHDPLELPLYLLTLCFFAGGLLLGSLMTWFGGGKTRKKSRDQRREIKTLEKELDKEKKEKDKTGLPQNEIFPALPKSSDSVIK